jgi:hypothetical protein
MSDSPLSPQEIRAAAETHAELGPEYSDAVVAAFLERVDRAVAARVDARLAEMRPPAPAHMHQPAPAYMRPPAPPAEQEDRRTLLKGVVIGVSLSGIALALVGGNPDERVHRIVWVLMIIAVVCALGATWAHRPQRFRRLPARAAVPGSDQHPY